jgi:acyl-coenzyme A thioesterase PaaI-like protein
VRKRLQNCAISVPPSPLFKAVRGHMMLARRFSVAAAPGVTPSSVISFISSQWPDHPVPGISCHEVSSSHCVLSHTVPPSAIRPGGYISGPTQFALVDIGMWASVFGLKGLEPMALTSELSIRYTRPAVGTTLWTRIDVESAGGRSVVMSGRVWTDDAKRPTAVAQGTYVMPRKGSSASASAS